MALGAIKPTRIELNSRNYYEYAASPYYHRLIVPALLHFARQQAQSDTEFKPTILNNMSELIVSEPGDKPGQHRMVMIYVDPLFQRKKALELSLDFSELNLTSQQLTNQILKAQGEAVTKPFTSSVQD